MKEEWKIIEEFPNYEVSNTGKIKRTKTGQIRKTIINNAGYECVVFHPHSNELYFRLVHRLVALAFVDGWFEGAEVNHKDENKLNNNADNLEWCTKKYNMRYSAKKPRKHSQKFYETHPKWGTYGYVPKIK